MATKQFWLCSLALALLANHAFTSRLTAQDPSTTKTRPKQSQSSQKTPPALKSYKGRRIAQTMHYTGAEWLTRDNREQEERCSLMLTNLGVKRGMTICDMGCGNGFYTLQLAKMVGDEGKVYGVDIQPEMLTFLQQRAAAENVTNIEPILGTFTDPKLPKGKIDLILLVDVYHELSNPEPMLTAMREALAPGGLCALVEFRAEDPNVPIKPEHKMTKAQIMKEWPANGFKLAKEFDGLPWQHLMFFGRDENWKPIPAKTPATKGNEENED